MRSARPPKIEYDRQGQPVFGGIPEAQLIRRGPPAMPCRIEPWERDAEAFKQRLNILATDRPRRSTEPEWQRDARRFRQQLDVHAAQVARRP